MKMNIGNEETKIDLQGHFDEVSQSEEEFQPLHELYTQTLKSKAVKSLNIYRLQRQIEEFYTEKLQ
jgi:uncharacterized protein YpiB (UPF0302 family)